MQGRISWEVLKLYLKEAADLMRTCARGVTRPTLFFRASIAKIDADKLAIPKLFLITFATPVRIMLKLVCRKCKYSF